MGPYISNYVLSELALLRKFREEDNYLVHIFPKVVEHKEWVKLLKEEGAKIYFVDYEPNTWRSINNLRRIFEKEKVNIIHCHFGGWDIDARLAAPLTPMVWHQRMYVNLNTLKRRLGYLVKYNILGIFRTRNIAISDAVYEAITSITYKKTYCIPDCIAFDRLHPDYTYRFRKKEKNGLYRVLLFGYAPYVKGVDVAYKACEILNERGVNVELQVVSQEQSDRYIHEHYDPMPHWLRLLPPSNNVSDYYNQADIFLSASRSEGFSNSLLEAIYCGCPIAFSNIPGTRWARGFNHTFEYEVESSLSLADALLKSLTIPISIEEIKANQILAEEQYSMDAWVRNVYQVLADFSQGK